MCVGVESRVGGQESAQWRAGLELAKQGHIANLRVLAIDVVSAPADGAPRWALPAWTPQPWHVPFCTGCYSKTIHDWTGMSGGYVKTSLM